MASLQIKLAMEALAAYEGDASFLRADPHEHLICPTCGFEHEKSFVEMLTYAEDARVLRELVVRLRDDMKEAAAAHAATRGQLSNLEERYQTVSEILSTRRGDLQFGDVVRSLGAELAFQTFEGELAKLKEQIDVALSALDTLSSKLAELTDPVRAKGILSTFRTSYSAAMLDLNVPLIDTNRIRISARPNVSWQWRSACGAGVLFGALECVLLLPTSRTRCHWSSIYPSNLGKTKRTCLELLNM